VKDALRGGAIAWFQNFDDRAAFTIDERWEKSVLALIAKVQIGEDEGELSQRAAIK
jgi:hypothetical protein